MGVSLDNRARTEARQEENAAKLDAIRLYTLTELEPILGVTHRTLQTYIKDGRLKGVKIGGKWKVSEEVLRRFINGESQDGAGGLFSYRRKSALTHHPQAGGQVLPERPPERERKDPLQIPAK